MQVMGEQLPVLWLEKHGQMIKRVSLAVVIAVLSHGLLAIWPVYSSGVIILLAVGIALVSIQQPVFALLGFLLAFAPSLLFLSGALAIVFVSIAIVLIMFLGRKVAGTTLKLALILAAPFALQHSWFFFVAILAALVYGKKGLYQTASGGILAFLLAWLDGWKIPGVFPQRSASFITSTGQTSFITWVSHRFSHPNWTSLSHLGSTLVPYGVSLIAGGLIIGLVGRLAALLRDNRGLKRDAVVISLSTLCGLIAWALISNEMHPSVSVGVGLLLPSFIAAVIVFGLAQAFPAEVEIVSANADASTSANTQSDGDGRYQRPPSAANLPSRLRRATWDDIAGYQDVKDELREAVQPYMDSKLRQELDRQGLPVVGGILLYGAPGTGKTLFARVLASETKMHFFSVSGPEFFTKWVGESESKLRELFANARAVTPSLIFFDEVESFLTPRDLAGSEGSGQVIRNVVATFLAEMDGAMDRGDVLVVAATNHPELLDPAAIRSGRFDKIIFVPPPDEEARRAIFTSSLEKRNGGELIDIDPLVAMTERFTAADITGIITSSYRAATQQSREVDQSELESLFKETKPTVTFQMLRHYEKMQDRFGRRSQVTGRSDVVTHERLGWDDIAGMEDAKAALREAVELPLLHPELYGEWGIKPHKGVLLYGPPGCGKSMFARVASDTASARFYTVNGPELLGGGAGEAEKRLRELFEGARENKPAVIFFDEIDAIATSRHLYQSAMQGPIVQQILTLMDGKDALEGVVTIAATNRPDQLDSALLRPGRFDRLIYVPLPDEASRKSQWQRHLLGKPGADGIDYDQIAVASAGYSGAEIEHIANKVAISGLLKASLDSDVRIVLGTQDVLDAIAMTPMLVSAEEVVAYDQIAQRLSR